MFWKTHCLHNEKDSSTWRVRMLPHQHGPGPSTTRTVRDPDISVQNCTQALAH